MALMLMLNQKSRVLGAADFAVKNPSAFNTMTKLFQDDRHPLSAKRGRNVLNWAKDSDPSEEMASLCWSPTCRRLCSRNSSRSRPPGPIFPWWRKNSPAETRKPSNPYLTTRFARGTENTENNPHPSRSCSLRPPHRCGGSQSQQIGSERHTLCLHLLRALCASNEPERHEGEWVVNDCGYGLRKRTLHFKPGGSL